LPAKIVPIREAVAASAPAELSPRTRRLLHGAILPTLLRMAWPNVLVMLAQASTGLIETWFVSRLGTHALAGMAVVFPGFMMMQMLSAGAMGGGISSAIARALGAGRRLDADALVLHGIIINGVLGAAFSALFLVFGETLYRSMGVDGDSLEAALTYSNIVFAGTMLVWLMNALASVIRGTGNMLVPSLAVCAGVALLVPLSPCLIFGFGPIPTLGIAGAGVVVGGEQLHGALLRQFYAAHNFEPVWTVRQAQADALLNAVLRAGEHGLDPDMFHGALLRNTAALPPIERELVLSDAFLAYAEALARGAVPIELRMDDEDLTPEPISVAAALDNASPAASSQTVRNMCLRLMVQLLSMNRLENPR
jgi:hypothetical protein